MQTCVDSFMHFMERSLLHRHLFRHGISFSWFEQGDVTTWFVLVPTRRRALLLQRQFVSRSFFAFDVYVAYTLSPSPWTVLSSSNIHLCRFTQAHAARLLDGLRAGQNLYLLHEHLPFSPAVLPYPPPCFPHTLSLFTTLAWDNEHSVVAVVAAGAGSFGGTWLA